MNNEKPKRKTVKNVKEGKEKKTHTPEPIARERIIKKLYETNFIPSYIRTLAHPTDAEFLNDLEQDIYLIVCSLSEEKLNDIYQGDINRLRRYVSGIIHRQIKSTTSAYYRRYKRPYEMTDKNNKYTLAQKEELNLYTSEYYEELENTDFSEKIKVLKMYGE